MVLALSNSIFAADENTKYGSLPHWRNLLSDPSAFILYLSPMSNPNDPVAFLFVVPRVYNPPIQNRFTTGSHIWLAGVTPQWRQSGCLTRLVQELDDVAMVTICTYPSRFQTMWSWLILPAWKYERALGGGKVMLGRPSRLEDGRPDVFLVSSKPFI
ncbi:hypothetical protein BD414DRAFT_488811 [Trametes punicea]|nr:hypothetical protein BD414DRAFT_488811 [Trametes punicea]